MSSKDNILADLPKAPSSIDPIGSTSGFENEDLFKNDDFGIEFDEPVTPIHQNQDIRFNNVPDQVLPETSQAPVELIATQEFDNALESASKARRLAAIYTKWADRHEMPSLEILQSDDVLSRVIEDTLIKQAQSFIQASRDILEQTAKDDNATDLLQSERVTTINALYDIQNKK